MDNAGALLDPTHKHRFKLWRMWNSELPKVLFIMLNPSTASFMTNDKTISRLVKFAQNLNYGGFYVGNLYSFRTPYPEDLYRLLEKNRALPENLQHISDMAKECKDVVFAWGNLPKTGIRRDVEIIEMFPEAYCFDTTAFGHPKHPLYLKGNSGIWKFAQLTEIRNKRYHKK